MALLTPCVACSVATDTTTRVAERADGGGPTARVLGVAAAAIAAAAAAARARRSRQSGVSVAFTARTG